MYNLLIVGGLDFWQEQNGQSGLPWNRFLAHTSEELRASFLPISPGAASALTSWPSLFLPEFHPTPEANDPSFGRVGTITEIRSRSKEVQFRFELDKDIAPIPISKIAQMVWDLDIDTGAWEHSRGHWAVKDVDLFAVLKRNGLIEEPQSIAPNIAEELLLLGSNKPSKVSQKAQVFVVHGRDDGIKNEVARWLARIGFNVIVLHEQPSLGRGLLTKFRETAQHANFAVVIMSPDDVGGLAGHEQHQRARQNVIFELGYFLGCLGPSRVVALVVGSEIEIPSDYDGVVYIQFDKPGAWKLALAREFKELDLPFDLSNGL